MDVVKVFAHLDLAINYVRKYEEETKSSFVMYKTKKRSFGSTEFDLQNDRHKMQWLSESGIPYFHINRMVFDCKHGPDRHVVLKERLKTQKEIEQKKILTRKPKSHAGKLDCPAQISLIEAITFPKYRVTDLTRARKTKTSNELRRELTEKGPDFVQPEKKILVILPSEDDHKNHPVGDAPGSHKLVDSKIKKRIQSLVADSSLTSVRDIKRSLEDFVRHELFPEPNELPNRTNQRFYPNERAIKNIAYATRRKLSFSKNEQKKTSDMVKEHAEKNPFDYVFFRPATRINPKEENDAQGNKMLFIFQSQEQKQLMNRYGNYVCLLDATYRTTNYSLPLFFICVKTYIDYHVIAMFVLQDEKTLSIMEALLRIKEENPGWQPKDFLTDHCNEEINAVEQVFDESFVFLSDFHREQAWVQWVSKLSNGIPANRKNEVLTFLRKVADSETEEEFEECLSNLQSSDLWQTNSSFQSWFTREWLPEHTLKRWVWAYRKDKLELNIYTNNGIEYQNESLRHKYLCNKKQQSLSSMIHIVITQFFPDQFMRYCEQNFRVCSEYRRYSSNVPSYLKDRPKSFVFHCIQQLAVAENIDPNHLQKMSNFPPISFSVQSQSNSDKRYLVSLGSQNDMPFCECLDWVKSKWLCKHFFAVFLNSDVSWNDLSILYRDSPYLNLDVTVPGMYIENKSEEPVFIVSNNGPVNHTAEEEPQLPEVNLPSTSEDKLSNSDLISRCSDYLADIQSRIFECIDRSSLEELERDLERISVRLRRQMVQKEGRTSVRNKRKPSSSQKRKKENNNETNSPECATLSTIIPHKDAEPARSNKKKRVELRHHFPFAQNSAQSTSCEDFEDHTVVIEDGIVSSFKFFVSEDNNNPVIVIASAGDDCTVIEKDIASSCNLLVPQNNEIPVTMTACTDTLIRHLQIKELQQKVKKIRHAENEIENDDLMEPISSDGEENEDNNSPLAGVSEWKKVGPYQLLESDRSIILNENAWLNDSLINAAQYIIKQRYPIVSGLQDTQLSKTLGFHSPEADKRFIQVLNVNGNHWVTIATSFGWSTVKIYDSLSASKTHSSVSFQEAVASILTTSEPTVSLITENVCQQSKASQCGVYAIAFAVALCNNIDPCTIVLHEDSLRKYLLRILETEQVGSLAFTRRELPPTKPIKESSFRVYCHCRLPWNHNNGIEMIECVTCQNWFHVDVCENVLPDALQNKKMDFSCSICQQKGLVQK